jgi:hypothetical protein
MIMGGPDQVGGNGAASAAAVGVLGRFVASTVVTHAAEPQVREPSPDYAIALEASPPCRQRRMAPCSPSSAPRSNTAAGVGGSCRQAVVKCV